MLIKLTTPLARPNVVAIELEEESPAVVDGKDGSATFYVRMVDASGRRSESRRVRVPLTGAQLISIGRTLLTNLQAEIPSAEIQGETLITAGTVQATV